VAAALKAGCTILYTEDMQHGQVVEGLRIENPFLGLVATKELAT
jgi:predicted nucleic acid-binding protein